MKKLLALSLALIMVFALAACGGVTAEEKVAQYVEMNSTELADGIKEGFELSGLSCTADVKAVGCGIVIGINVTMFEDLSAEDKQIVDEAYDDSSATAAFDKALKELQTELPEAKYLQINICEKDGDVITEIVVGNK